ncbi:cytochrome C [Bradyrhizobium sp.]|uniref:cytochrome C n=1 Tax=Bradyrhizobium sp. TaxID=376 RepID=UPI001ECCF663|nr:cytochrome C [Bradyrhizobium sp.]MBV8923329.1 cytochrome C [Bradyrhizobium sp.]MBV9979306.1 cytochrome C [Bradyrhizobium sp.]
MPREAGSRGFDPARLLVAAAILIATVAASLVPEQAFALPSYARQTGLGCGMCHTEFPQLTPFGRRFKILGYTLGYSVPEDKRVLGTTPYEKNIQRPPDATLPLSVQAITSFTHTAMNMNTAGSAPYLKPNNNIEPVQTASIFYGGAISEHIGAYAQFTYNAQPFGPPLPHQYTWDNLDVRYANTTTIAGMPAVYGLTLNNNPTVQDPWNSTPAWGYPFVQTNLANTPGAKTLIDQGFAAQVLGLGAYTFINDQLYLEVAGYQTLNPGALNSLGVSPLNTQPIKGVAPYFRAAYEKQWGRHILEIGTFGFFAETGLSIANFVPGLGTNRFTDIGFDSQYQYQGDGYWVTLRATYLHEKQNLPASVAAGLAGNLNNTLNTFRAQAALTYGTDGKIVLTGGYFNTWGTADPILFAGNRTFLPNSDGFTAEIAYQFFGKNNAPKLWPWFNTRLGVQYIAYNKFNGASTNFDNMGTNARDNNTLLVYLWSAF